MTARTIRLRVAGRVQGVGYRDFLRGEAESRGLVGWVRNRRDGTVEAIICGAAEGVDELIAACWRGPPASRVADIQVEASPKDADLPTTGFTIRPSA
ncbi:MAG TPA: acylphosphatase [Vitreimonas sp.]|nr:acylphosphatase [Vitreimonas sp.]